MEERCTYCHDGTERENPQGLHELGCPWRTCPQCGRTYFDAAYEEDALHLYHLKPPMPTGLVAHLLIFFGMLLPVTAKLALMRLEGTFVPWEMLLPVGLITLVALGKICWKLYPRIFRKRVERKCEEGKIPIFNGSQYVSDEFSQSLQRMSREEYLYDLIAHGVEVPEFFFRRIGRTVDTERVEELKAERQAHFEGRARKEQLRKVRADLAYYEDCLSMDQESRQFAAMAKAGGLSAGEFRTRCETEARKLRKKLTESEQTEV